MGSPSLNWDFEISMVFTSFLGVKWSLISFNRSNILFSLASVRMNLCCLFFFTVAPSPVRNVHARPLSSTTVEVTWTAPNQTRGTIVLYSVLYEKENVCCLQVNVYNCYQFSCQFT